MSRFSIKSCIRRFLALDRGAALVEFALILPTALVIFAVMFEAGRLMFAYQAAVSGVRDAARFAARAGNANIVCSLSESDWASFRERTEANLSALMGGENSLFTVQTVTVGSECPPINDYLGSQVDLREPGVGVVTVSATVRIDFLFGPVLGLFGGSLSGVTARVNDQSRVYGT